MLLNFQILNFFPTAFYITLIYAKVLQITIQICSAFTTVCLRIFNCTLALLGFFVYLKCQKQCKKKKFKLFLLSVCLVIQDSGFMILWPKKYPINILYEF